LLYYCFLLWEGGIIRLIHLNVYYTHEKLNRVENSVSHLEKMVASQKQV
jgi:hypothetical protein